MHLVDYEIQNKKVRLIGDTYSKDEILDTGDAINIALDNGLNLVEMSESDGVSICKFMDYSKYLYEQKKAKKTVKKSILKDIKFGCNIADHDLKISAKKALNILNEGDKVRVLVVFKGRQIALANTLGQELLDKFVSYFEPDVLSITKSAKLEGNMVSMIIEKKRK